MFARRSRVGVEPAVSADAESGLSVEKDDSSALDGASRRTSWGVEQRWTASEPQKAHAARVPPSAAPQRAEGSTTKATAYSVGSSVRVRFQGGAMWYPAEILRAHEDETFDVLYTNGAEESGVPAELVQPPLVSAEERAAAESVAAAQAMKDSGAHIAKAEASVSRRDGAALLAKRRPRSASRIAPVSSMPVGTVADVGTLVWHGSYLWKIPFTKGSVPKLRWFKLLPASHSDGPVLQWSNPRSTKNNKPRQVFLDDVREVNLGHKSTAFARQIGKRGVESLPPAALCFSLVTSDRTVDVGAQNVQEAREWIRSIRILTRVPVNALPATRGDVGGGSAAHATSSFQSDDPRTKRPGTANFTFVLVFSSQNISTSIFFLFKIFNRCAHRRQCQ